MALQDRFSRPKGRQPEPVSANPPSKSDISFLMERAAQTSPQVQILRWQSGCETFMLCVNYAEGPLGEPTWELSTGEESGEIFWSVTTENPAEIYRLVMKRLPPLQGMQVNQVSNRHQDPVLEPSPLFRDAQAYRRLDEEELFARRYRVMFQIGHGGMGRVYQACDVEHNRVVALKVLHPHLVEDEHAKKRFDREAKATIHLRHPNLLMVHDYGFSEEGLPYIAMEYLEGEVLHKKIKLDGPLEVRRFLQIFIQTCSALHHAHVNRVIHRDVKPTNIMLVRVDKNNDFVKLVDFGIAQIVRADGRAIEKLTQTGDVFGSPFYMSPEQCTGKDLDARSDIYSLGCVMYEAISGIRPFYGPNALSTMQLQVTAAPKAFKEVCADLGVPIQVESVILRCLEKEPGNRFQTAKEVAQALEHLLSVDEINLDDQWISRQTESGNFLTLRQGSSESEKTDLADVLNLLKESDLINQFEHRQALQLLGSHGSEVTRFLLDSGKITEQTLHAAAQCQRMVESGKCKIELAIIALHYCCRNQVTLREALDQLGWRIEAPP